MAMFGADVTALASLAHQLDQASQALAGSRTRISSQVSNSAWVGPIADRFRADWSSHNNSRLASAEQLLSTAATLLRMNAEQQSQASDASGSPAVGTSVSTSRTPGDGANFGEILEDFGGTLQAMSDRDILGQLQFLHKVPGLEEADKFLGPAAFLIGAGTVAVDISKHDVIGALMDGTSTIVGGVATGATFAGAVTVGVGVGIIGAGVAAGVTLVQSSLPYTPESQGAMVKYVLEDQGFKNVNPDDLTPPEQAIIGHRYEGPLGVAQMISDKMRQSGAPEQQWVGKVAVPAVEKAASEAGKAVAEFGGFLGSVVKGITG